MKCSILLFQSERYRWRCFQRDRTIFSSQQGAEEGVEVTLQQTLLKSSSQAGIEIICVSNQPVVVAVCCHLTGSVQDYCCAATIQHSIQSLKVFYVACTDNILIQYTHIKLLLLIKKMPFCRTKQFTLEKYKKAFKMQSHKSQ